MIFSSWVSRIALEAEPFDHAQAQPWQLVRHREPGRSAFCFELDTDDRMRSTIENSDQQIADTVPTAVLESDHGGLELKI